MPSQHIPETRNWVSSKEMKHHIIVKCGDVSHGKGWGVGGGGGEDWWLEGEGSDLHVYLQMNRYIYLH